MAEGGLSGRQRWQFDLMKTERIKVQKGEKIQTAWERLVRWVDTLKVVPGEGVKVRETPKGTIVTVLKQRQVFSHPFKAGLGDATASLRAGTVNGQVPYILDVTTKNWRRIDNRDDDGNKFESEKTTPAMKLDLKNQEGGKFYLSLRVKPNDAGTIKEPKNDLRIVQTKTAEGDKDGVGYYPLALCYLNEAGTAVEETFQIVHHNMRYLYQARKSTEGETTGNRHLFFPV
jgi:hypothetical protein